MFKITQGKGFHIAFENGYTVSVQFGYGNYCDNKHASPPDTTSKGYEYHQKTLGETGSSDAEVAVWNPEGDMICAKEYGECGSDTVAGWLLPAEVVKVLVWAESQ